LQFRFDLFTRDAFASIELIQADADLAAHLCKVGRNRFGRTNQNAVVSLLGNEKASVLEPISPPSGCRKDNRSTPADPTRTPTRPLFTHADRL
jgi:hypothetical protein